LNQGRKNPILEKKLKNKKNRKNRKKMIFFGYGKMLEVWEKNLGEKNEH
jgi:hypothetical protein